MFALLFSAVLVAAGPAQIVADASPFIVASFPEACAQARTSGKLVLLYFADAEDADSERMTRETFAAEQVQAWLREHVVALVPAAEEREDLRQRFGVRAFPTVVVVSPVGVKRAVVIGYSAPDVLLHSLEHRLETSDPVAAAARRLDEPGADQATARIGYGKALAEAGRSAEALAQFMRCFKAQPDQADPLGGGVRFVAVAEMGRLAHNYAPARDAMREQRDVVRRRIVDLAAQRHDPALLAALNRELKETDDTLALYRQMRADHPQSITTGLLKQSVLEAWYEARAYGKIAELIDVMAYARRAHAQHLEDARCELPPGPDLKRFRAFQHLEYAKQAAKYYEMLLGNGRHEDAAEVARLVLEVNDGGQIHALLVGAALRAGQVTAATLPHVRRALETDEALDAHELKELVVALEKLAQLDPAAKPLAEQVRQRLKGGA